MTAAERAILVGLDQILRSEKVGMFIRPVVERVRARLSQETGALMAWEPIPLTIYGGALPDAIKSSWVFVLRAGANTGAERHPNSHQRMMSFQGSGDMQLQAGSLAPNDESWQSNILISDSDAPLEKRWISIPQNVWHQPVISKEADWVVVSFHTVPAEELIEERPESSGPERTKQMRYLG
ncbi:MAG: hypothetical protein DME32_13485 [Verrucomicrobia bacterium]|nr:MAG: hypothetical protein DME32_13485 [Verrucomicrobiota bacterium]